MENFKFRVNEIRVYGGSPEAHKTPSFDFTYMDDAFNGVAIEDPT